MFYPRFLSYLLTSLLGTTISLSLSVAAQASSPESDRIAPPRLGWRSLLNLFTQEPPEPPNNGGSRPLNINNLCWIAPVSQSDAAVVGSDRPTLTWYSPNDIITQVQLTPTDHRHPPLIYDISADQHKLNTDLSIYQFTPEHPLEAGVTYEWQMYQAIPGQTDLGAPLPYVEQIRVMTTEESDRLAADLAQQEQNQIAQGMVGEAAVLQRSAFFGQRGLWAEMWTILLSQSEPSEELEQAISDTITSLCGLPEQERT